MSGYVPQPASPSAAIRARLDHPVIDSDGHTLEFEPAVMDCLREIAGDAVVARYLSGRREGAAGGLSTVTTWSSPEERRDRRAPMSPWWVEPTRNTLDRATAILPKLLYQRLDEFGIDVSVIFPTYGLFPPHFDDEELRRTVTRAFNTYNALSFAEYSDRLISVATIPMHTPQEAIEELEFAVHTLDAKVVMLMGHVFRPVPYVAREHPEAARYATWLDTYCIDSEYDYDPVWAKCVELGVPVAFHSTGQGWGGHASISNYMYNHIGHFPASHEAICKALLMGGVTRRFPELNFAFMEGGAGWGAMVYADIVGRWSKRNPKALENIDPANIDQALLAQLFREYGGPQHDGRLAEAHGATLAKRAPEQLDDFRLCEITRPEDIKDLFDAFYFGCEADDPMNALAFNTRINPMGAKFRAVFGSDIGHWDVPDMTEVTSEAYEVVENGLITEEDFRDFVFTNPVALWTKTNPNFFKGTVVEAEVSNLLAATAAPTDRRSAS